MGEGEEHDRKQKVVVFLLAWEENSETLYIYALHDPESRIQNHAKATFVQKTKGRFVCIRKWKTAKQNSEQQLALLADDSDCRANVKMERENEKLVP